MKYETLSEFKSDVSLATDATSTFTFTFSNNIDHIVCLFFHPAGANSTYRTSSGSVITSSSISNNFLTIVVTNKNASTIIYDLFILVTVASY